MKSINKKFSAISSPYFFINHYFSRTVKPYFEKSYTFEGYGLSIVNYVEFNSVMLQQELKSNLHKYIKIKGKNK
jgi:hypothetical protein